MNDNKPFWTIAVCLFVLTGFIAIQTFLQLVAASLAIFGG